ncbi:MAG: CHAT domain-containing protein, partial [Ktedonobacteraceae bacterium]
YQPAMSQQQDLYAAYNVYLRARKRIREQDNPDFMASEPTFQQIGKALIASDEALIYLVASSSITSTGGMALIVTLDAGGNPQATPAPLPRLHELALFDLFEVTDGATPVVRIDEALTTLGEMGLNELTALLLRKCITKARLIPYGWLGLFPLPAVLVTDLNGQRRHLSELFAEVTIAPSARSLEIAWQGVRSQDHQRHALLIAGDPEPHPPEEDLPFALAEAGAIRRIARKHGHPEAHICYLPPRDITRERLMEELPRARYAHLALHAEYCAGDPRRSRLILADTGGSARQARHIYLGEMLDGIVNMRGVRLLALSACETSVIDMQRVPNEALGIAAGFLQAGAAAVMASLWPVDDAATFLLMTRFARFYLDTQGLWS